MQQSQTDQIEKEWQYRSIFDAATDGLIINDLETGLVVEANPAACLMHGFTREEFIGLHLTGFVHPDSQDEFSEYIRAFQAEGVFDTRILHIRKDGSTFYAEWRGTAFTYQGRSCLLGIVRDVSDRVQAERLLQQRVEARTREQSALLEISSARPRNNAFRALHSLTQRPSEPTATWCKNPEALPATIH